ncbi:hypothetical protein D9615_000776 [Tricholomella constricta]|uniref:deuterolysin n=1 Tax=Tricholomella constricta TaxID=117010 RepID=A0A8H5HQL5_9AGAR|nr:hypothetical protein D9615_000776 [Tricholomella constricta]
MLFSSFAALCLASTALAGPHKRFEGLTVELSGPPATVSSVENLKFKAVVKNGGTEAVKIFKYSTILDDKLPTRSFAITKDGKAVPFTGVKLSISLDALDDNAFTVIPAGDSVTVEHDVASLYDFASVGTGSFSFKPITNFRLLAADDEAKGNFSKVEVNANDMVIKVTKDIAKRELPQVNKRAVDTCQEGWKKSFIDDSYMEGKSLAGYGASYINANGANTLFQSFWGNSTTSKVLSVLDAVANENSSNRTLSCVDSYGVCTGGVIAYTVVSTTNIYYCDLFFKQVSTIAVCSTTTVAARNLRSGTTLHELTHAVAGTEDISYGCSADQELSDAQAVMNADNYNCFASQVYRNTRCS